MDKYQLTPILGLKAIMQRIKLAFLFLEKLSRVFIFSQNFFWGE